MSQKSTGSFVLSLGAVVCTAAVMSFVLSGCGTKASGPTNTASDAASGDESGSRATKSTSSANRDRYAHSSSDPDWAGAKRGGTLPNKPPVMPGRSLNAAAPPVSYEVPGGQPEEILAFIQQLETIEPQGDTQEEAMSQFTKIQRARIEGSERILASQANDEIRMTAVHTKVDALRVLDETGALDAKDQLVRFANALQADTNAEIALLGKLMSFGFHVDDYVSGRTPQFELLTNELTQLLSDKSAHPHLVALGQEVASALYGAGHKGQAGQVMRSIGERLKEDQELAEVAGSLIDQARMIDMDFESKMNAALANKPNATAELIAAIKQLIGTGQPTVTVFEVTARAGQNLEVGGNYEGAAEIYRFMAELFKSHSNAQLAEAAINQSQNGLRRVGLIGKPFDLTGRTLDGEPFDWNQYRGKVVLVDFWATWCGPCLHEIPNIEQNYQTFHSQGFEVVGINLDEDRADLDGFLAQKSLPWTTVVSADPNAQGFQNPVTVQNGIDAIPFLVLVNQDGVAVALHVRGEELRQRLTQMLGPTEVSSRDNPVPHGSSADSTPTKQGDADLARRQKNRTAN